MPEAVVKGQLVLKLLRLIDTRMRVLPLKWGQPEIMKNLLSAKNVKHVQLMGGTITNSDFLLIRKYQEYFIIITWQVRTWWWRPPDKAVVMYIDEQISVVEDVSSYKVFQHL